MGVHIPSTQDHGGAEGEDAGGECGRGLTPDSVPIESEEERAADEMAALDAVGDYEADPNVMLEDVPSRHRHQDSEGVVCMCSCVGVCVFACNREGTSHTSSRVDGRFE